MSLNTFISDIKFYDNTNFPYEFSRCGDFTLKEAETLTNCGYIMQQLEKKQMQPENEEHNHFLDVIEGKHNPLYNHEYVYLKYLNLIEQKKTVICNVQKVTKNETNFDDSLLDGV